MPAAALLFALLLVASIAGTVGLWLAIDRETDDSPTMDRADAERAARQDTHGERDGTDDGEDADDSWGSDAEWGVEESRE